MRLIDADALFRKVKTECNPYGKPSIGFEDGKRVMNWIEQAPTVVTDINVPNKWISVTDKEKLPKGECIAYSNKFDEMMIGYIGEAQDSDTGYIAENEGEFLYDVTHWMPLPEPPKKE